MNASTISSRLMARARRWPCVCDDLLAQLAGEPAPGRSRPSSSLIAAAPESARTQRAQVACSARLDACPAACSTARYWSSAMSCASRRLQSLPSDAQPALVEVLSAGRLRPRYFGLDAVVDAPWPALGRQTLRRTLRRLLFSVLRRSRGEALFLQLVASPLLEDRAFSCSTASPDLRQDPPLIVSPSTSMMM